MLVCWWWRFDWSFARCIAPFVVTTSIVRAPIKSIQNGDILVPANLGCPGNKMAVKRVLLCVIGRSCLCNRNSDFEFLCNSGCLYSGIDLLRCKTNVFIVSPPRLSNKIQHGDIVVFPSVLWHCWLDDGKGIRPVISWVLVGWWWWFDWSFARLVAPVVRLSLPSPSSFASINTG